MADDQPVRPVQASSSIQRQQALNQMHTRMQAQKLQARQISAKASLSSFVEQNVAFNPFAMLKNARTLEDRRRLEHKESQSAKKEEESDVKIIDEVTKTADEYESRNPELNKRSLLHLKTTIEPGDGPEEILRKILKSYPDHFLADEALAFLEDSETTDSKLKPNIVLARQLLNERFGREVRAGRNINLEAREFSRQGLGSPGALRDLYRDITGNPREALTLFEELSETFSFDKMKTVIQFVLHSIGSDLKSKGPSISRGELSRLFTEARVMQSILGVFRFFFHRMKLIEGAFNREDLTLPPKLTFELLAKQFIKLLSERYPSPDKILRLASILGISEELLAQIIIFTQYRDAIRGVSPRFFKSDKHRQDMLMALIETISELDDLLEEEEEEEEEEKGPPTGYSQEDTIE